jgi:outer membrane protein OmpA-like peptidoglycan-associated protein
MISRPVKHLALPLLVASAYLCSPQYSFAQPKAKEAPIVLNNPSFEDIPTQGKTPTGWYDCGRPGESAPDIQPGQYGVTTLPKQGDSYLGMVVRDNETWEAVGQRLKAPLINGHCYDFAIDMCRSDKYTSKSHKTQVDAQYTSPVTVLIWGGNDYCQKAEFLAQCSDVTNTRWLTFPYRLSPKKGSYSFLLIEAYYHTPVLFPYNGNVLLDNATIIEAVDCAEKVDIPPTKVQTGTVAVAKPKPAKVPSVTPVSYSKPTAPVATNEKLDKAKKGETIRLERITFMADSYELQPDSEPSLQEVYDFLKNNEDVVVEVGGHTNGVPPDEFCDQLSTNRAKNVANWLIQKGIAPDRVKYKGYGKRKPLAPNTTKEGRAQNQRVEVKILSRNGG